MTFETQDSSLELPPVAAIPAYLQQTYWWAYIHPNAVTFFERQWLVNLILWGNFARLRDAALDELGRKVTGRTLQVACVYGDFSTQLVKRFAPDAWLDVVDVLPIQLRNLRQKLPASAPVTLHQRDSTALGFTDESYDQAILFFLLHEQPAAVRRNTLLEALRVVKPGGRLGAGRLPPAAPPAPAALPVSAGAKNARALRARLMASRHHRVAARGRRRRANPQADLLWRAVPEDRY
jgi:SAM-dependent methyltransferase